jgi:PKD repeat protein
VGEAGPDQRTPNIALVIQEIVGRTGWSSGNALAIIITGSGERTAESYNGHPAGAPLLHVEYDEPPAVTILSPEDAANLTAGQTMGFSGTASDAEDGDVTSQIAWSSDVDGPFGTGGSVPTSSLSLGSHVISASVTDNFGQTSVARITIAVNPNTAPSVTIAAPPSGSTFGNGQNIAFSGTASDAEDGDLTASLNWDSNPDGGIGTGGLVSTAALSVGTHTITATATDSGGMTGSAQISVTVAVFDPGALQPLKVAFIGDLDNGSAAVAVLNLIQSEGTDMVLHQGDFDYSDDPANWDAMITGVLGASFPYFASPGNHDDAAWDGPGGYQDMLLTRLAAIPEASCSGDLGVQSACTFKGLFFILSGAGTIPNAEDNASHIAYITEQLAQTNAPMRICSWHKVQKLMQVGNKSDEVGWGPYEACREGGAIVATAHEHSYSRTHLLDNFTTQSVVDTSNTLTIEKGKTFAFVSGLGGKSIRDQNRDGPWWASIYTSTQGANYGALFCTFFVDGDPTRASCYFKDIDGFVPDQFEIVSAVSGLVASFTADPESGEAPVSVSFDAWASVDTDGTIVAYDWDFDDGTTGTGEITNHEFVNLRSYAVTLTVTNDLAETATATRVVTATGPLPNQSPLASFTATPNGGDAPLVVGFDAIGSSDPDGSIVAYDWDYGDDAAGTGESANHEFVDPGAYLVTLTVTDDEGAAAIATTTIPVGVAGSIDARVASANDDAEENASGSINRSSTDLELVDEGSKNQIVGMRFAGIEIPQGSEIFSAHVQFQVDETDSGPVSLQIRGQAADDTLSFSSSKGDISSRPTTTAFVNWTPPPWTTVGSDGVDQRTPDLWAIVQEIVDRADWSAGNAMVIIVTGSGERTAESFNGSSSAAPLLHVEYIASLGG